MLEAEPKECTEGGVRGENSFQQSHKREKKRKVLPGKGYGVMREIWGTWLWVFFSGLLFNTLHHGIGFLDSKQHGTTQAKLDTKGRCWETAGSSEWNLMWRASLGPLGWEPSDSRPQHRSHATVLPCHRHRRKDSGCLSFASQLKIQSLREAGALLGEPWPYAFCPWTIEEYLSECISRSTYSLPGYFPPDSAMESRSPDRPTARCNKLSTLDSGGGAGW